jgi:carbonic anhydrase
MKRSVEANVMASVSQLSHSSRIIEGLVEQGDLRIIGAVLELATGRVRFWRYKCNSPVGAPEVG